MKKPLQLITFNFVQYEGDVDDYEALRRLLEAMDAVELSRSCFVTDMDIPPADVFDAIRSLVHQVDDVLVFTPDGPFVGQHREDGLAWRGERLPG